MTTVAASGDARQSPARSRVAGRPIGILAILGLLTATIAARRTLVAAGADGLLVGVAFGAVLAGIGFAGGWRPRRSSARSLAGSLVAGSAAALALVALALLGRVHGPWIPLDPGASLVPWAQVTILVATAEELVLRGALLEAVSDGWGPAVAIAATAAVFALLHVPLYGWAVVPLDAGVGVLLGGLRVMTGGVLAPAVAHVVADLAAWWL
jgi:membrane protease YdiL (CAAX protease family)